jgi:hypothetical protein
MIRRENTRREDWLSGIKISSPPAPLQRRGEFRQENKNAQSKPYAQRLAAKKINT